MMAVAIAAVVAETTEPRREYSRSLSTVESGHRRARDAEGLSGALTLPFDRGQDSGDCSMNDCGLRAGGVVSLD